jgi:hypothetical protein
MGVGVGAVKSRGVERSMMVKMLQDGYEFDEEEEDDRRRTRGKEVGGGWGSTDAREEENSQNMDGQD